VDENFLVQILDSWPRLWRLLFVLAIVLLAISGAVILVLEFLPTQVGELQFSIGDSHVVLKQPTKNGDTFLFVVSPQGWNQTGIQIKDGDAVNILAGGKIHIDLSGLEAALEARRKAERRISDSNLVKPGNAPEDYHTDAEKKDIEDFWEWSGPEGVTPDQMKERAKGERHNRSVLPNQPYGVLTGAFFDSDDPPETISQALVAAAFPIGNRWRQKATAKRSGFLYLTVNDVLYKPGPQLFFVDNLGHFYVKIEVSK